MLTREQILAGGPAMPWPTIDIPEWGGVFKLRPLSGTLAEETQLLIEQAVVTGKFTCMQGLRARIAVHCVCGDDDQPLFKPADAESLTERYLPILQRIFDRVKQTLNLTKAETEAVEKNS